MIGETAFKRQRYMESMILNSYDRRTRLKGEPVHPGQIQLFGEGCLKVKRVSAVLHPKFWEMGGQLVFC